MAKIGKTSVDLEILERRLVDRELPHTLTLAVSLPKGDRQKFLVEKLVELGVTRRSPWKPRGAWPRRRPRWLVRLRRQVIEASKQCGRNRLMEISEPQSIASLLQKSSDERRVLADPSGEPWQSQPGVATLAAIGPEGGFTGDELAQGRNAGWEIASPGLRILEDRNRGRSGGSEAILKYQTARLQPLLGFRHERVFGRFVPRLRR